MHSWPRHFYFGSDLVPMSGMYLRDYMITSVFLQFQTEFSPRSRTNGLVRRTARNGLSFVGSSMPVVPLVADCSFIEDLKFCDNLDFLL
jgi:hypothetical protein